MPTIINGETVNVEVTGNNPEITANGTNVEVTVSSSPTLERKFCIWKLRFENNIAEYEVVNLVNNITGISLTTAGSEVYISGPFSENPFAIHITNYQSQGTSVFSVDFGYLIQNLELVFSDGQSVSEWSYITVEDLGIYLP